MVWTTEFSEAAEHDFELIFDHLFQSYVQFGEQPASAFAKATERLEAIRTTASAISKAPYRGTLRDAIAPGLRQVTIDRAVFWFDLDETRRKVRILAIFFGGQDHIRHMLARLLKGDPSA
ncbi:MAG: type II toxin-antitoxin system RelE/ParE family toxin [Alphaproteobacteria bacterium]|jgi:plasmid stabilization system protein ParE|nr:type II toxin-antitoxin system RelE/ParE family toxin [Alphaproteobacteria bacterium]MDP6563462.1 type II toxin-antitoxin system RelE/ParE family toxin [Alphaproteobacteria bacterium]